MMDKGKSLALTIIGFTQALICLFVGGVSAIYGLYLFVMGWICETGESGDLSGLSVIMGFGMLIIGVAFVAGFVLAVLLIKRDPRGRKFTVIFMGATNVLFLLPIVRTFLFPFGVTYPWSVLFVGLFNVAAMISLTRPQVKEQFIQGENSAISHREVRIFSLVVLVALGFLFCRIVHDKIDKDKYRAAERAKEIQILQQRDAEILNKLSNSKYAVLQVVCKIQENVQGNDIKTRQAERRKFVVESIIKPLGLQNISNYQVDNWGDYDVYFIADVTRDGYEVLKKNNNVWMIELCNENKCSKPKKSSEEN